MKRRPPKPQPTALSPRAREILARMQRLKTITVAEAVTEDLTLIDRVVLDRLQQEDEAQLARDLGKRKR